MKMEGYFDLPFNTRWLREGDWSDEECKAVAHAINCHDDLVACVEAFQFHGCPVCGGDCGSANPPVVICPMRMASAILTKAKGE